MAKALQYAAAAASPERWLDAEYYKRALLFTGAYSLKQAAASCLKDVSPNRPPLASPTPTVVKPLQLGIPMFLGKVT